QPGRKVVHHEPVQVLQGTCRSAAPGPGHTGDDHHLRRQVLTQFDRHASPPPSSLSSSLVLLSLPPVRCACTVSARLRPIPGTFAISSGLAPESLRTEPNSLMSAARREGPNPASSSRLLPVRALARFCRW